MYHRIPAYLLLVAHAACLVSAQFFNPTEDGKSVWRIGETQVIKFRTTLTNFNIALWQQSPQGGSANLGPIMYQTTVGTDSEFAFIVNIGDLDLQNSNKFFLWLKQGGIEQQSNGTAIGMSSSYFRITDQPAPVSSSSAASQTTTTPPASPTTLATIASHTATPTGGSSQSAETAAGISNAPAQDGIVISTGAVAGIGAAAGILGLAAIIGVVYFCFKRKWKQREKELQSQHQSQNEWRGAGGYAGSATPPSSVPASFASPYQDPSIQRQHSTHHPQQDWKSSLPRYPTEMPGDKSFAPVELPGDMGVSSHRSFE